MSDLDKPSTLEDEYFAREDIEKKRKLALQQADELAAKQREELKALHYMKCPRCGLDLQALKKGDVEVDTCFHCHGMWLEAGELEKLLEKNAHPHRGAIIHAVLNIVRNK